jgi:hypothetical protein
MLLSSRYLTVAATALALAGSVAAETEFFAVLQATKKAMWVPRDHSTGGVPICEAQDGGFSIVAFAEHTPEAKDNCDLVAHVEAEGKSLEGCTEGAFSNGFRVCGTKVHNGKGQHQQCEEDDTTVGECTCYPSHL